jgi:glycosyltransferase involved in cell wall biosynthesis
MSNQTITVHCLVRNEERFIWYALRSVLPYVDRVLVFDTGSTDHTNEIIASIKDERITHIQKGEVSKQEFYQLRQEQIEKTTTDWILVLDGDEIWPKEAIEELVAAIKNASDTTWALVSPFINCVETPLYFESLDRGSYTINGKKDFHTVRAMRCLPGLTVTGDYGVEGYYTANGKQLHENSSHLDFLTKRYIHTSNLVRSGGLAHDWKIAYRRRKVYQGGRGMRYPVYEALSRTAFAEPVPIIDFYPLRVRSSLFARVLRFLVQFLHNFLRPS